MIYVPCTYTDGSEREDGGGAEEDVRKDPGHAERGEQGPGAHHLLQESTWPGTVSVSEGQEMLLLELSTKVLKVQCPEKAPTKALFSLSHLKSIKTLCYNLLISWAIILYLCSPTSDPRIFS